MKFSHKFTDKSDLDSVKFHGGRPVLRFALFLTIFFSASYVFYTLKIISSSHSCHGDDLHPSLSSSSSTANRRHLGHRIAAQSQNTQEKTEMKHVVFGIAASASLWDSRKEFIKLWWRPENGMRGFVWIDRPVKTNPIDKLPPVLISGNTSEFPYTNNQGDRSAIRISRIVSETVKRGLKNVRWLVMGDDDTVFITENLVRVLSKYDHRGYYYIGSSSESHLQNIYFSYGMAYGGGGFAISYPLAVAIEKMQGRCLHRYPDLYGSDDRIHACMSELGVPLTKEPGFHQFDIYGNLFGLLAAHPVAPLVSLHHLDILEPIFPNMTRLQSLKHLLTAPNQLDSAALIQHSICYETKKKWTISISWGFAVQVIRGIVPAKDMERPSRTFLNWYKKADYKAYAFNTRPVNRNMCQKAFIFFLSNAKLLESTSNLTVSKYEQHHQILHQECRWKMPDPAKLKEVLVYKQSDPHLWERSPRRNCCRVAESRTKDLVLEVGVCKEGEVAEA
ncbi:uncharacterized protein LOC124932694 [Impatiens glandulifera]|uniref:uncharacterized protein LOC124932694 n=1 Tax=Impatiens glandulifera TaxID=253017 RepID=UPI001FB0D78B|nr:uncharacterized protein LOC124932694 [Impatiens glandulifera]